MTNDRLEYVRERIADHLEAICTFFTQRPKITVVIRTPWIDEQPGKEGGIIISDDDYDLAIAEINKLRNAPPVGLKKLCNCGADRTGPSAEAHREDCPQEILDRLYIEREAINVRIGNLEACGGGKSA